MGVADLDSFLLSEIAFSIEVPLLRYKYFNGANRAFSNFLVYLQLQRTKFKVLKTVSIRTRNCNLKTRFAENLDSIWRDVIPPTAKYRLAK